MTWSFVGMWSLKFQSAALAALLIVQTKALGFGSRVFRAVRKAAAAMDG
jgi:hypothetical protein